MRKKERKNMEYDGSVRISTIIDTTGIKTGVKEIMGEFEKHTIKPYCRYLPGA